MLEHRIIQTLVHLADTLVGDFDTIDFLHTLTERCVELVDVDAAGILLADQRGTLSLTAASTDQARFLELFELQQEQGPSMDCYRTGQPMECVDLASDLGRWPEFGPVATDRGFAAVFAIPMRLRQQVIGAVSLFRRAPGPLSGTTGMVARSFADVATISILQVRATREHELVTEQLQFALNSRVLIEQATGVLAGQHDIDVAEAFTCLRRYSRARDQRLAEVARLVVRRAPEVADLMSSPPGDAIRP